MPTVVPVPVLTVAVEVLVATSVMVEAEVVVATVVAAMAAVVTELVATVVEAMEQVRYELMILHTTSSMDTFKKYFHFAKM